MEDMNCKSVEGKATWDRLDICKRDVQKLVQKPSGKMVPENTVRKNRLAPQGLRNYFINDTKFLNVANDDDEREVRYHFDGNYRKERGQEKLFNLFERSSAIVFSAQSKRRWF